MEQNNGLKAYYEVCKKCEFFTKLEEKDNKTTVKCRCEYLKQEESPNIGYFLKDANGKDIFGNDGCENIPSECTYYIEHFYLREFKNEENASKA